MKKRIMSALLIVALVGAEETIPSNFSVYTLDNGLQILLIENPALPMVGVNVVVKTGSAYETFKSNGMSHMLEHLLFNGTESMPQEELYTATDLIGGYNNANTGEYYTNYMMVTPAEFIEKGMELQADMLFNSILPPEKFEKEKGIVLEEIARSLGDPDEQRARNLQAVLFPGHALSLPTLGTYSTIESLDRDGVMDYYKNNYVPNNMVLTAVGNFRAADMLEDIKRIYGTYPPGNVSRPVNTVLATGFQPPKEYGPVATRSMFRSYGGDDNVVEMIYRLPDHFQDEHLTLLDEVLEGQINTIEEQVKKKYDGAIKSIRYTLYPSPVASYLVFEMKSNTGPVSETARHDLEERLRSVRFRISQQKIAALLTRERTGFLKSLEKPHMFGIYNAARIAESGIDGIFAELNPSYATAATTLKRFRLTEPYRILRQVPLTGAEADTTEPVVIRLFADKPGQPVLIIKQNTASPLLAIHYLFKHKAYFEHTYGTDAAQILHDCFGQRMKSERNQKQSGQFGFTFTFNDNPYIPMDDIYLHPDFGYIRVEGLAAEPEKAIRFLSAQINSFIPTEAEYKRAREKFSREKESRHGGNQAREEFRETYQNAIYEPLSWEDEPAELTYEDLLRFTKEYFRPSNQVISVVSPQDPDEIATYFPGGDVSPSNPELPREPREHRLKTITEPIRIEKDGQGEQTFLFWGFIRDIDQNDIPALKALSLVLGNKIVFDIREKLGMAYRMSAGIEPVKDKALFYIRLGTRPANADLLTPRFPDYFTTDVLNDISDEDVTKAINMYLGRMMFRRLSAINQAYYLAHSYYFHQDIFYDQNFHQQLRGITRDDVLAVGAKYLSAENPVLIIVR